MLYNEGALNNGCVFERAFDILYHQMNEGIQGLLTSNPGINKLDAALIVPVLTNGAFACELYIKAMLPEGTTGHDLEELFTNLEERIQKNVSRLTIEKIDNPQYSEEEFWEDLHTGRNIFPEWRYFHESNGQKGPIRFLSCFIKALLEVGKAERQNV